MQFLHTQNTENWISAEAIYPHYIPQCGALLTAYNSTSIMALEIFSSLIKCSGDPYTYVYIYIYILNSGDCKFLWRLCSAEGNNTTSCSMLGCYMQCKDTSKLLLADTNSNSC